MTMTNVRVPDKHTALKAFLVIIVLAGLGVLLYYVLKKKDGDDSNKNHNSSKDVEHFTQGAGGVKVYNAADIKENICGGYNSVMDGYDTAANMSGSCGGAVPEPHKPHVKFGASHNSYASTHYHDKYPNEQSTNSLQVGAGGKNYGCASDVNNTEDCDYALNTDNLMPGSWRDGDQCPDGSDPNSQWAKYHPTKEAYWRYITAAGSARTAVNTRIPWRIVGQPLLLRPGTATPLTHTWATPFGESSLRQDVLADAHGYYPEWNAC